MHPRTTVLTSTILLLAVLACAPARGAVTFLRTQGQDMVDESGRKVLLQGVGLGNWLLPEGYMWRFAGQGDRPRRIEKAVSDLIGPASAARFWSDFRRDYITESDIARIAELGFNSVRPALNARLFLTEGDNPAYVEEGFQLLDQLVDWCGKHNLYVILDMHGAPGGQTGQNIDDSANDQPELFTDTKNQDRLVDLWVKIASRYADKPAVAAYDLLNEPLPQRTGAAAKYKDQLEPLYKRITAAIREVDKRHMITVEGCDWANDWSVFSTPFDDNLFYQFHYYCWDRPSKLNDITRYLDQRQKLNAPVWVGETGEKDNAIYWATTQYFEAHNIGWSFWPWKKMDTTNTPYSIKTPEGWDAIRAYTRDGTKPSAEAAQKSFDELLENIKLANCVYCPDVVSAIFRRVPGRVEAENYGAEGPGRSYWVADARQKSKYYRLSESVPVEPIAGGQRQNAGQAIRLGPEEWTAYTVRSLAARDYTGMLRANAQGGPAVVEFSVNGQAQDLVVDGADWSEIPLKAAAFKAGTNRLQFRVKVGSVSLDWLAFSEIPGQEPRQLQTQAGAGPAVSILDTFEGKLGLPWDIVHPLASHWSLTKHPGALTITTGTGAFGRSRKDYKNLFLLDSPAAPGQDFQVTTCLVSFHPKALWHQAGLVLWNDEDNFMALVYEWGEGPPELHLKNQRVFTLGIEVHGTPMFAWYYANQNLEKVWLRVTKRANWLELSASEDGETFAPLRPMRPGTGPLLPVGNGMARRVGLFAGNGSAGGVEPIDASFDSFEFKTLGTQPDVRPSRSYQLADIVGRWSWVQGPWRGDFVVRMDADVCTGILNDVYEGTFGDPIQDISVVDNRLKLTRRGRYSIQHWEGPLIEEAGVLKVLDGQWTSEGGRAGRFVAEKTGAEPNSPPPAPADGPVNLGPNVNTYCHEGSPDISADGLTLLFDALNRPGGQGGWDIWMSRATTPHRDFDLAAPLPAPINSPCNDSGPCLSADGLTLYFGSDRPGGSGGFDLYVSTRETTDGPWGEPVNLEPAVNSQYYDNLPCISADGLTLYFVSARPGVPGQSGETDLYLTKRATVNDPWGAPEPLAVNTLGREYSPHVSRDDLTLYYDSPYEGRDLWGTRRASPQDPWQKGVRLEPPVNTPGIDTDPSLSADGSLLYFVSDRPDGCGGFDIWVMDVKKAQNLESNNSPPRAAPDSLPRSTP